MKYALTADLQLTLGTLLCTTVGMTFIYGLTDPRIGTGHRAVRYVGKADDPTQRRRLHLIPFHLRGFSHKQNWFKQLLRLGLKPGLLILQTVDEVEWKEAERFWMAALRRCGCRLVNADRGGRGGSKPGGKRSLKTRKKIAAALTGNKNARGYQNALGYRHTDEAKRRIGEASRTASAKTREKQRQAMLGNKNALGPHGYALGRDG
ncbi:hypothetical protein LCGC14_1828840 [marine sediment metagenome]|uniref:Nuclease associated modular domain-containing protein n=1 Tax=marine sediment metagenome TaxID=412755 RepID=A0A0F9H4V5_9ZZZZ